MKAKKIFILLPDGVSLRNFAYTSFYAEGKTKGYEIIFWNNTPFDLESLGFDQIPIRNQKASTLTDILKTARTRVELGLFEKRDRDPIYQGYLFPLSFRNFKSIIKSRLIQWYHWRYKSEKGLNTLRKRIKTSERKGSYYTYCKKVLGREQPDLLFCASQRSVQAIAPVLAAADLSIPTATFIFSWDNVPKATTVIETNYYFAWSDHMKKELLHYHKYLNKDQIIVTGTPQFTPHYDQGRILSREDFCKQIGIATTDKFICFSGDDITTSPKDELYLRDVAQAARHSTEKGHPYKIVFRRCPVDFSDRYKAVMEEFNDVIVEVKPIWEKIGAGWNTILPTAKDIDLQVNIMAHCEGVINLGSSMVFDAIAHEKPCAYMNYNYLNNEGVYEAGVYVYDFVHFRSMPTKKAVLWLNHPDEIANQLLIMIKNPQETIEGAKQWFAVINRIPAEQVSEAIWEEINTILLG